jgi:hypothetical protein
MFESPVCGIISYDRPLTAPQRQLTNNISFICWIINLHYLNLNINNTRSEGLETLQWEMKVDLMSFARIYMLT